MQRLSHGLSICYVTLDELYIYIYIYIYIYNTFVLTFNIFTTTIYATLSAFYGFLQEFGTITSVMMPLTIIWKISRKTSKLR